MAAAATTPDAQEGIAAFLEKRRPDFGSGGAGRAAVRAVGPVAVVADGARA